MSITIPPTPLGKYSNICAEPLLSIINIDISSNKFDDSHKRADLVPIHKHDDNTNKKNYRNVSLLPAVSKIFERIMQRQIGAYIYSFLSDFLCGYRKGYNSQYALLSMLEKWRIALD